MVSLFHLLPSFIEKSFIVPNKYYFNSKLHRLELKRFFSPFSLAVLLRQQWCLPGGQRLQFSILAAFVAAMRGRSVCNKHRERGRCADSAEAMLMRLSPAKCLSDRRGWLAAAAAVHRHSGRLFIRGRGTSSDLAGKESGSLREKFKGPLWFYFSNSRKKKNTLQLNCAFISVEQQKKERKKKHARRSTGNLTGNRATRTFFSSGHSMYCK